MLMKTPTTPEAGTPANSPDLQARPRELQADSRAFAFLDLKAQFSLIKDEVLHSLERVMESQQFILGPEVRSFEEEMSAFIGTRAAVGCASGSDALLLALLALGIGSGDEVITTPFTFVATAGSVARAGAKPVFVDIHPETFNIDPNQIRAAVNERTCAIIPVHLFGLAADLNPILKMADDHKLAVIEDAAQALGARYNGTPVGSLGTFGCFSFFPSKNLGGAGDGGMVTTNDPSLADRLRLLRVHGSPKKYYYEILGTNSRLDSLQAAILRVKLRHLQAWTIARQQKAETYRMLFAECGLDTRLKLPYAPTDCLHVLNQFVVRCPERDSLRDYLRGQGVPTEVYYPLPLHLQPAFAYLGYKPGQLPQAEAASREVLALPIYPELGLDRQTTVVRAIAKFYGTAT
jgi:dTDP-4-amino-4,6-dideoxygalactose transaminase